ncbi:DNA alkylation repair protein [Candidatus Roizmanbacteria bacterium RIFCSPHIGHO2_02_FULL_37_13b]|uniref:DNA alkylation repair protein n=1 Tax=Candidatus Roizmanbacteria bacterium RIFCSPLOWO2_02_FULL_36_11 TaxID=1802071 RepID=A0A1F7JCE7_9BACT|nr:MAG: DNA alkylation repair protein [Candidatus Roizmanbacteria bacterium RIFCSPHIGHO2_02_FULL_37_13b]OGK53284.1 MAG: DNA alkylation repair protein [Candidatus Roizmanbacteria bacterium RIFCSPLOWO2_02_FULL_36_11]
MLDKLIYDIRILKNPQKATLLQRYFKTGKGEYAEGDKFLGLTVPICRQISKKNKDLSLSDLKELLKSRYHEERLIALLILVSQFGKNQKKIFDFYLSSTKYINNWDLVDLTAPKIVGQYLYHLKDADIRSKQLKKLATSNNLWQRRIAVLATFYFIHENHFDESLQIAKMLLQDRHDLIHKAIGWMLREVGKRDQNVEEIFLRKYYQKMPRTMLRYAIEKFPDSLRRFYLARST